MSGLWSLTSHFIGAVCIMFCILSWFVHKTQKALINFLYISACEITLLSTMDGIKNLAEYVLLYFDCSQTKPE